jgi:hypothetical protein
LEYFIRLAAQNRRFMAMLPAAGPLVVKDALNGFLMVEQTNGEHVIVDAQMTVGWYASPPFEPPATGQQWGFFKPMMKITCEPLLDARYQATVCLSLKYTHAVEGWLACYGEGASEWLVHEGLLCGEYRNPAAWKVDGTIEAPAAASEKVNIGPHAHVPIYVPPGVSS